MLSQLNYKAAAYLNGGDAPDRQPLGAHTFYVPAQLFETASGYLALFVTHDEFWRRLCVEIDRAGMGRRPALRHDARALRAPRRAARRAGRAPARGAGDGVGGAAAPARDRGGRGGRPRRRARRRARAVTRHGRDRRHAPTARSAWSATRSASTATPAEYRPPPRLHEHTAELLAPSVLPSRAESGVVVDDDLRAGGERLAGEHPALVDLFGRRARCSRASRPRPRRGAPCTSRSCPPRTRTAGSGPRAAAVSRIVSPAW